MLRAAAARRGRTVEIEASMEANGAGPIRARFAVHGECAEIRVNGRPAAMERLCVRLAGSDLEVRATGPTTFG